MKSQTIIFIHGAHVTARCWEPFISFFEAKGYTCTAPNWPYDDRAIADLRAKPAPELGKLGVAEIVAHYAAIIQKMNTAPIIIGHSFGGLFTQLLLDQGLGAAGVALDPAPPKGVFPTPAAVKSNMGPLVAPLTGKKLITMSEKDFGRYFANGIPEAERAQAYQTHIVPTPVRIFIQSATALFHNVTAINYRRPTRAPLLITAGGQDRQVPAGMNRANYKLYQSTPKARVDFKEFAGRSHTLIMEPGWEEVANYIDEWLG